MSAPPLPAVLRDHVPAGATVATLNYYQGPFQHFEEALTADMDWDVAPGLAILPTPVGRLIEPCAGAGRLTATFARVASRVVAVERSPVAAARLRERFADDNTVTVIEAAIEEVHVSTWIDTVALLGLSAHVLPPATLAATIAMAGRCLPPGGAFCVNLLADDVSTRMSRADDVVRRRRYHDVDGRPREMLTTTRFDPAMHVLDQHWLLADDPARVAAAWMRSHFPPVDQLVDAMARAGLRVEARIDAPIGGGVGRGAAVAFLRAVRS